MLRTSLFLFALSVLLSVSLLSGARAAETFNDGTGHAVPLGQAAERIVSLAPNVTEMLYFLGLGPKVVARTEFCDFPPEVFELPAVGGFNTTSLEAIVALRPQLVVAYQGNSLELVGQLRQAGIPVVALKEAEGLADVATQMKQLWRVAGPPKAAVPAQVTIWEANLGKETIKSYPNAKFFRFFFGYPGETTFTAGPGSFITDLLKRAGAVNVVSSGTAWPQVSPEFIVGARPDWLLLSTSCTADEDPESKREEMLKDLRADPAWASIPAVKHGQVIVLDSDVLLRPGPRQLEALRQLNRQLTSATMQRMLSEGA